MKKVLVITGGSRGIGAATARLGAASGYAVCINYRHNDAAALAVVEEIARAGGEAIAVAGDVGSEADVVRLFDEVDEKLGPVTALVNNAGILETQMRVEQMDAARLSRVLSINVIGSFLCAREAIRRMSTQHGGKGGAIVNVSSIASRLGAPNEYVDYAAAKGAIDSFTIGLAKEVAAEGIQRDLHRDPRQRRRARPGRAREDFRTHAAGRRSPGGRAGHSLAALRRGLLLDRRAAGCDGRKIATCRQKQRVTMPRCRLPKGVGRCDRLRASACACDTSPPVARHGNQSQFSRESQA